ncbi:MAG: hypothetical protein NZ699_15995 [Roseiflexus sp.]|nr:hypothetical protein [Roseiflexus sp.]MCS7290628.1 hypothetical protein [Roseiflexus sp.]MDW8145500.1 hypothetical protein [Roseiflexaceae bacterium]MDW8231420.1 hypothetical protein [Roseiflexaceae bacterium]
MHSTRYRARTSLRVAQRNDDTGAELFPSGTLPARRSICHGVPPTRHGITTNIFVPMARPLPGVF